MAMKFQGALAVLWQLVVEQHIGRVVRVMGLPSVTALITAIAELIHVALSLLVIRQLRGHVVYVKVYL